MKKKTTGIGSLIFLADGHLIKDFSIKSHLLKIKPRSLRLFKNQPYQIADPFLFVKDEQLFVFYEEKSKSDPGRIFVSGLSEVNKGLPQECILTSKNHLSFPFVFQEIKDVYMIPETASDKEVALYYPTMFPVQWEKSAVLLRGNYVDSHIYVKDGYYYLFSTLKERQGEKGDWQYYLKLFYSDQLLGPYKEHPKSPIQRGRKFGRSGGAVIEDNGKMFRVSQDCSESYGNDLILFEILTLSPSNYEEKVVCVDWFRRILKEPHGGHHLSFVDFKGRRIWAVDMNMQDSWFQRFVKLIQS